MSYTPKRAEAVDFSDSYYDVNQAVVALKSSKIADAASIADLADAKLGAPVGTTSYDYIVENVKPSKKPSVYNTLNDAIAGLKAKQIDGIVVDLSDGVFHHGRPGAERQDRGPVPGRRDTGVLRPRAREGQPAHRLRERAIGKLRDDGTLDSLQQEWLSDKASAPVLE